MKIPIYGYLTENEIEELKKEMTKNGGYPICYRDEKTDKPTYCKSCVEQYYNKKMRHLKSLHNKF